MVRGGLVESVHDVAIAVVAPGGAVVAETPGAAALPVFLRSAAKPFQAEPAVRAGVLERLGLDDRHLALACASHLGEDRHVALAAEILAAAGLEAGVLQCGSDDRPSPLHHMCSGNHALGLAWCVCEGWPTAGYLEPGHPLQVAMRAAVSATAGAVPEEAVDGCGMRAYRLPLHRYAALFGALGSATGPLGRCAAAMRAHPELVRGAGEIDTELMRAEAGSRREGRCRGDDRHGPRRRSRAGPEGARRSLAGDGAGSRSRRAGGLRPARPTAMALTRHATPPIMNARGEQVGSLVIRIALMRETM